MSWNNRGLHACILVYVGDPTVYPNYGEYTYYMVYVTFRSHSSILFDHRIQEGVSQKNWPIDEIQKSQKDA